MDLDNLNNIDLECDIEDDDDFGKMRVYDSDAPASSTASTSMNEERDMSPEKTGIIIHFNGDEVLRDKPTMITAKMTPHGNLEIHNNRNTFDDPYGGIDMECDCCEDDDFADDIEEAESSTGGLVDEEMLEEKRKKKSISTAQAESNYLAKLQKQHEKTIKKGAMGMHFHLGGDPQKDAAFFNHVNGTDIPAGAAAAGDATGVSAGGEGGGMGESLHKQLLDEALLIIGFDVLENSDHSYSAIDTCDSENDFSCNNKEELYYQLKPYIDDCFILPLQIATGEKFENCADWVNWYSDENAKKFPKCASDINYCRAIAKQFEE